MVRGKLGLFRIIGGQRDGIGFVSCVCMRTDRGDPDFEIPGSKRDAAVAWALVCNSSCVRCCFVLNCAMHYTTVMPKKQVFSGFFVQLRRYIPGP